jgi:hypothetical protein
MAITARTKKKIRNGLESLRKNARIQETKKSYTQEQPVSIKPDFIEPPPICGRDANVRWTPVNSKQHKKMTASIFHESRH